MNKTKIIFLSVVLFCVVVLGVLFFVKKNDSSVPINKDEYQDLLNEFDKIMDSLDAQDELREMYDELLKIK